MRNRPRGATPPIRAGLLALALASGACSLVAPYEHTTSPAGDRAPGSRGRLALAQPPEALPGVATAAPVPPAPPAEPAVPLRLTAARLERAWSRETVPCVRADGSTGPQAKTIPIVDDGTELWFADGAQLLDRAPAETRAWLGAQPFAIVVWDPNACEYEDWNSDERDGDWRSAGLLIRGAWLEGDALRFAPELTVEAINLVNTSGSTGALKDEVARASDAELAADYPQLFQPVLRAKIALLAAAHAAGDD